MILLRRLLRARMLQPLHGRDFALLTVAAGISLFGDGFFFVALAWQVYEISNVPTALSLVGVAWTLPMVLFLLIGGALSDRYDRRRLMIAADLIRAGALAGMAALSLGGVIELWHVAVLIAVVGVGDAFFNPASTAIVPDLVATEELPQANALTGMLRPLMVRMLGPAVAGLVIGAFGPGVAFGIDAATFIVSGIVLLGIRARPTMGQVTGGVRKATHEIAEGLRFVLAHPWLWATLLAAMLSLLVFFGPVEVLVPFLVKNRLGLGPESLGLIFAAGGVGAVIMSIAVGQLGLPRMRITVMYSAWSIGVALMAIFGLMTSLWHALLASLAMQALFQLGQVIWITLLQQHVPRQMLGRVASLDWMVSTGLVPLSFALTGPASELFGPAETMVGAALLGAVLMGALLFVRGVRDLEREPVPAQAEPAT